jgi:hypothetical protein
MKWEMQYKNPDHIHFIDWSIKYGESHGLIFILFFRCLAFAECVSSGAIVRQIKGLLSFVILKNGGMEHKNPKLFLLRAGLKIT